MPPHEMLYGRRYRTPICWGEVGQRELGSTKIVQKTTESIQLIRDRLKTAQSRQKSYADKKRSNLEFNMGDDVLLKKLGSRFIGPFKVIARVGKVAYRLELPLELSLIHNTFYVSDKGATFGLEMGRMLVHRWDEMVMHKDQGWTGLKMDANGVFGPQNGPILLLP
ncbi:hypothetical protein OSB04_012165 [Centaurea solstitialis]|uniref:Tf2-1-like SH3-like domain-containing protein n=1 Tax=Centaurea solstitialis TaxID=347529 RepID=A0AA38TNX6_9ASTR|nr:hypothetical protein OSB04_012165 [Centaurea solstitialis]